MKHKHLGYMATLAVAMLTFASCSNDVPYDYEGESSYNNELMDITFSISTEDLGFASRADDELSNEGIGQQQRLSRGSEIDMLVYAVYMHDPDQTGSLEYKLLTQYGQGYIDTEGKFTNYFDNKKAFLAPSEREGQTIVAVPNVFNKTDGTYGDYKLTLRLMRNQTYTIAFWAQSSETAAYDTHNFEAITVDYKDYYNNDEKRDAFCKAENFSVGNNSPIRTVVLTRPFSQINVATTGADYKNLVEGAKVYKNMAYRYSKITLKGVAEKFDLVRDLIDETKLTDVTFDWGKMPAFMNLDEKDHFNADQDVSKMTDEEKKEFYNNLIKRDGEEFLYVKLEPGSTYLPYKTDWPTYEEGKFKTEVFKYLSMCYVLVPAAKKYEAADGEKLPDYMDSDYVTSVLKEVKFEFAENKDGENSNGYQNFKTLTHVPVKRNWRTNILAGFGENANSSIFSLNDATIIQNSKFDGTQPEIFETND